MMINAMKGSMCNIDCKPSLESPIIILCIHLKGGMGHWALVVWKVKPSGVIECYFIDSMNNAKSSIHVKSRVREMPFFPLEYEKNWTNVTTPQQVGVDCGARMALHTYIAASNNCCRYNPDSSL